VQSLFSGVRENIGFFPVPNRPQVSAVENGKLF